MEAWKKSLFSLELNEKSNEGGLFADLLRPAFLISDE